MLRFNAPATPLAMLLVAALALTASAQFSLCTPIDHDIGDNGLMFDLKPTGYYVSVKDIDVVFDSTGTTDVEVWKVTGGGTWVGKETDSNAWTLCGSNTLNVFSTSIPISLGIPLGIELVVNQLNGLYVTTTGSVDHIRYTTGTNLGGLRSQTPHLQLYEGCGKHYPFASTFGGNVPGGPSRMFNGAIHYSIESSGYAQSLAAGSVWGATYGLVFDIEARDPVTVEGFSLDLFAGTHDLEVWTPRLGEDWGSVANDFSKWMLAGKVNDFTAGAFGRYDVGFDLNVPIPAGTKRGFYVARANPGAGIGWDDGPSSSGAQHAVDPFIELESGFVATYPLAVIGTIPAGLCGEVHYRRNMTDFGSYTYGSVLPATNGPNVGPGLFFDLAAVDDFCQITDIGARLYPGTYTVELWIVRNRTTHIGKETNQSFWTRVGSEAVTVPAGAEVLTPVFHDLRIVLEPGMVQGCYITTTSGSTGYISYSVATQGSVYNSDSFIEIRGGARANYPFQPTISGRGPDIEVTASHNDYNTGSIFEPFSTTTGTTPPSGWMSHLGDGNFFATDGWRFDNASTVVVPPNEPIDTKFAVVDSDYSGPNNPIDAFLYSPRFYGGLPNVSMSFDHFHYPLASTVTVEIWDGAVWNNVLTDTGGTANPEHVVIDVRAASGASVEARARFRYQGDYDWHWVIDNVSIKRTYAGQAPRPGLSVFDLNNATEAGNKPVTSNLPGPYTAFGHTAAPADFHFEGEPNQAVLLMHGSYNPAGWDFLSFGKLDIGQYVPTTGAFLYIEQLAFGGDPGYVNSLFILSGAGSLDLAFPLPPFMIGQNYTFQSLILSSHTFSSLSNAVRLFVVD